MARTRWSEDEEFSGDDVGYSSWQKDWVRRGHVAESERLGELERLEQEALYRKGQAECQVRRRRAELAAKRDGHAPINRRALYERDQGICQICAEPVAFEGMDVDHIYPIARGGSHTLSNVQIAHHLCNLRKGIQVERQAHQ